MVRAHEHRVRLKVTQLAAREKTRVAIHRACSTTPKDETRVCTMVCECDGAAKT